MRESSRNCLAWSSPLVLCLSSGYFIFCPSGLVFISRLEGKPMQISRAVSLCGFLPFGTLSHKFLPLYLFLLWDHCNVPVNPPHRPIQKASPGAEPCDSKSCHIDCPSLRDPSPVLPFVQFLNLFDKNISFLVVKVDSEFCSSYSIKVKTKSFFYFLVDIFPHIVIYKKEEYWKSPAIMDLFLPLVL